MRHKLTHRLRHCGDRIKAMRLFRSTRMIPSPMQYLTSYAIAFAAGAAAVAGLHAYGEWMRARGRRETAVS
jgi:hypothetical protein